MHRSKEYVKKLNSSCVIIHYEITITMTDKDNSASINSEIETTNQTKLFDLIYENPHLASYILDSLKNINVSDVKGVIFHLGKPCGLHECSHCRVLKDSNNFSYYDQRVDKNGYLQRSNALCRDCRKATDSERKTTLDKATKNGEIGEKPLPGALCPGCDRNWGTEKEPRNWHRDHDAKKNIFRGWLCGDCNMAKHDHRHGIS